MYIGNKFLMHMLERNMPLSLIAVVHVDLSSIIKYEQITLTCVCVNFR